MGRLEIFQIFHEHFGGLEGGDFVFGDDNSGVQGDVAGSLLGAGFDDEAAEAAEIDWLAVSERVFNNFHELFDSLKNIGAFDTGSLRNLVYDFCFGHSGIYINKFN